MMQGPNAPVGVVFLGELIAGLLEGEYPFLPLLLR